jgi:hypothetical protein
MPVLDKQLMLSAGWGCAFGGSEVGGAYWGGMVLSLGDFGLCSSNAGLSLLLLIDPLSKLLRPLLYTVYMYLAAAECHGGVGHWGAGRVCCPVRWYTALSLIIYIYYIFGHIYPILRKFFPYC